MADVGLFPQDGQRLRSQVQDLLTAAPDRSLEPELLVAPHGSLTEVGEVLAAAYGAIDTDPYRNIVLLAGKHRDIGPELAFTEQPFQTPLGEVGIDELFTKQLMLAEPFRRHAKLHELEQAIPAQLPFLQVLLPQANIVPLIVGNSIGQERLEAVVRVLDDTLHANDLLVAVTNLAQADKTREQDVLQEKSSLFVNSIANRDLEAIEEQGKEMDVCGWRALEAGMATLGDDPVFHRLRHLTVREGKRGYGAASCCFTAQSQPG